MSCHYESSVTPRVGDAESGGGDSDRKKLQAKLARSLPDRTKYQKRRRRFIKHRRSGRAHYRVDVKKKKVKNVVSQQDRLILPEDEFWLLPRYIKKFGNPTKPCSKEKRQTLRKDWTT